MSRTSMSASGTSPARSAWTLAGAPGRPRNLSITAATSVMSTEPSGGKQGVVSQPPVTSPQRPVATASGAEKLASGMVFKRIAEGDGPMPEPSDSVKVHYHGTLRDGSVFDSTRDKEPAQFAVGGMIPCFSEGLLKMKVGGKAKLTCPAEIAYGERGRPGSIRPGAALTFEIELVEVIGRPATPESSPVP